MKKPNREIVRAEVPSSGDVGCLPIGLSFMRFAASWHIVCRLKKIISLPPTTTVITFFTDFTRASEVPFLLRSIGWKKSPFHSLFRAGRGQLVPISRFGNFPKLLVGYCQLAPLSEINFTAYPRSDSNFLKTIKNFSRL